MPRHLKYDLLLDKGIVELCTSTIDHQVARLFKALELPLYGQLSGCPGRTLDLPHEAIHNNVRSLHLIACTRLQEFNDTTKVFGQYLSDLKLMLFWRRLHTLGDNNFTLIPHVRGLYYAPVGIWERGFSSSWLGFRGRFLMISKRSPVVGDS